MLWSLVRETPMKEIFGETSCWIFSIALACRSLKAVFGGFFMAFYRIICMKRTDIAINLQNQKRITNQLFFLEFVIMVFFLGVCIYGNTMTGSSLSIAFCRGHSIVMDHIIQETTGTTPWTISVGNKIMNTLILYVQVFTALELIAYIILFRDFYIHNEKMKKNNGLGISKEILNETKRKNVINVVGQFLTFVIEIVAATISQLVVVNSGSNFSNDILPPPFIFCSALVTLTFFIASPELKRFYFNTVPMLEWVQWVQLHPLNFGI